MRAMELLPPRRRAVRAPKWAGELLATTASSARLPWRDGALTAVERAADGSELPRGGFGDTWSSLGIDHGLHTPRDIASTPSSQRRPTSRSIAAAGTFHEMVRLRDENERLRARLGAMERQLSAPPLSGVKAPDEDTRPEQHDHPLARPRTVALISFTSAQHL